MNFYPVFCIVKAISHFEGRTKAEDILKLRRIFGTKWEEWRKLHNKELSGLYSSPSIVMEVVEMAQTCRRYTENRKYILWI